MRELSGITENDLVFALSAEEETQSPAQGLALEQQKGKSY
jgi:hypothetical protein